MAIRGYTSGQARVDSCPSLFSFRNFGFWGLKIVQVARSASSWSLVITSFLDGALFIFLRIVSMSVSAMSLRLSSGLFL